MKRLIFKVLMIPVMLLTFTACPQDPDFGTESHAKKYLKDEYMDVYYYWNDEINKKANPNLPIEEYFNALLYAKDRWSWMMDNSGLVTMQTGVVTGSFGMSVAQSVEYYGDYDILVRYVIKDGPADKAGIERGWVITHLGGVETMTLIREGKINDELSKSPQKYTFRLPDGSSKEITLSATTLNEPSYLDVQIFTPEDFDGLNENVGYFNYLSFTASKLNEIRTAMATLKSHNVKKMILDLRYNGGGDGEASQLLVNYLAPKSADGEIYAIRSHNKILKLAGWNESLKIERDENALDLDQLYIITGEGSASASEVVLNGLKPLMNIQHVGDTTYGKPNGMYILIYPGEKEYYDEFNLGKYDNIQWCFLPISFYTTNKDGYGNYEDGLIPDHYRPDNLYEPFGAEEDLIKACLTHITTGKYPQLPAKKSRVKSISNIDGNIAIEKRDPNWGEYRVVPPTFK